MSGSYRSESDTTWRVKEHDEAKYNFSDEKGVWQPKPEDILSLFEKLAQGHPLPLKWTCPGRRPPDKDVKSDKNIEDEMDEDGKDLRKEELKAPEMSAFDFDEPYIDVNAKLIPKRAPGGVGRTPKTEKRVARMDNIMKSLHKQQLQRTADREARKAKGSPSSTPNRPRLLNFGSDIPKNVTIGTSLTSSPQSSSASSPRFGRGSTSFSSSPLLKKGPAFTTPMSAARKMTPQLSTTAHMLTAEPRVSESSSASVPQGSSLSSGENQSGQFTTAVGQFEGGMSVDDVSVSAQPKLISTSSSFTSVNNSFARGNVSTPGMLSNVTSSAASASNSSSSSPVTTLDKEYIPATSITTTDSSHPFASVPAQIAVSTAASTTSANPSVNVTSASEAHSVHSAGASASVVASHADSGMSLKTACLDAVNDHLVNLTESVTLSATGDPDVHNSANIN